MSKIFFLRHFETEYNKMGVISGRSEANIVQERSIGVSVKLFDIIYCSPAKRCRETINALDDVESGRIIITNCLLERNMGYFEGNKKSDLTKLYPDLFYNNAFNLFKTPPGGESYQDFYDRVNTFYKEYLVHSLEERILVCSHNQTLKLLRLLFLNKVIDYDAWREYAFPNGKIITIA